MPVLHSAVEGPLVRQQASLHHLGFVVGSIATAAGSFATAMSATWDGEIIHDPVQQVRVSFFWPFDARNPVFELVEPAEPQSPVSSFLQKGGGLHHVCYEVDDLDLALREAKAVGFTVAAPPAPAVAFHDRRIAWVCSRTRMLMEFLERERA